jgi:hypothetical protein
VVLQGIDVALRCLLDEIAIEDLTAVLLVLQPLGADLEPVVEPIGEDAGQAADSGAHERCEGGNGGRIHLVFLKPRPDWAFAAC